MHRLFYFELPSAPIKNRLAVFSSSCGMLLRRACGAAAGNTSAVQNSHDQLRWPHCGQNGPRWTCGPGICSYGKNCALSLFLTQHVDSKTFWWYFVGVWNRQVSLVFCCISSSILTATLRLPKIHTGGLYRSTCSDPHRRLLTPHM